MILNLILRHQTLYMRGSKCFPRGNPTLTLEGVPSREGFQLNPRGVRPYFAMKSAKKLRKYHGSRNCSPLWIRACYRSTLYSPVILQLISWFQLIGWKLAKNKNARHGLRTMKKWFFLKSLEVMRVLSADPTNISPDPLSA